MGFSDLQPSLRGPELSLRPLLQADFESLFAAAGDPLIWQQHPEPMRFQKENFKRYFQTGIESRGAFLISSNASGEVLGCSRFYDHDVQLKQISIGYTFLVRKCWGGVFNRELKHLMLLHAFNFVETVLFEVGPDNIRSRRALDKIGARLTGEKLKIAADGQKRPSLTYTLLRENYKSLINA